MFNCDSEMNDNPSIRRMVDGQPVNEVDVSVEMQGTLNGQSVTLRKVQRRKFSKDKTSYADDNTYFWNDVPVTLKEFNSRIGVDINALKMCTNINVFLGKKQTDIRAYLMSKIQDVTDYDIASMDDSLKELVDSLQTYTVDEIRAIANKSKTTITQELPILTGQIKEKERDIQTASDIDVAEYELGRNDVKRSLEENRLKQKNIDKTVTDRNKILDEIAKMQATIKTAQYEADKKQQDLIDDAKAKILAVKIERTSKNAPLSYIESKIKDNEAKIQQNKDKLTALREEYKAVYGSELDPNSLYCKYCGQLYPADKKEQISADFNTRKVSELERIAKAGNTAKQTVQDCESENKEYEEQKAQLEEKMKQLLNKQTQLESELSSIPTTIDISDREDIVALKQGINKKQEEYNSFTSTDDFLLNLKKEEQELMNQLLSYEKQIAASDTSKDEERLEELKKKKIDMEQKKNDNDRILYLLDELTKKKNDLCVESVNSMFRLVKWNLYELAKNGNYKNICTPTLDGKSIIDNCSNKGNKIIGRIDILNSIQNLEGISVPVFLDDMESLDDSNFEKVSSMIDSQTVMMVVSNSTKLDIKNI
jgi:hypothetical protein